MKTKIIITLSLLALVLLGTLTYGLMILVKVPVLVIPFIGLMAIAMFMSIYSMYLKLKYAQ